MSVKRREGHEKEEEAVAGFAKNVSIYLGISTYVCVSVRICERVKKRSCNYLAKTRIRIRLRFRSFSFFFVAFYLTFKFDKFGRCRNLGSAVQLDCENSCCLFFKPNAVAAAFNQLAISYRLVKS